MKKKKLTLKWDRSSICYDPAKVKTNNGIIVIIIITKKLSSSGVILHELILYLA